VPYPSPGSDSDAQPYSHADTDPYTHAYPDADARANL
jgi:hypothetical protein